MANETMEQGYVPQPEAAKPHVNNDEKHVSSEPVVVFSAEDEKLLHDISTTTFVVPVPASAKRLMGKRTSSQRQKGGKGDGQVFTIETVPRNMFKPKMSSGTILSVDQDVLLQAWFTTSVTVATFSALGFTIGALDQISPLTALFDQYRIKEVEVWIVPQLDASISVPQSNFATVIDYDDTNTLTTYAQALDYVNCVTANGAMAHYRRFVPHVAAAAYSGAFTSFMNVTAPWIDAASSGVIHYGIKAASTVGTKVCVYDATYRLHTQWRNLR